MPFIYDASGALSITGVYDYIPLADPSVQGLLTLGSTDGVQSVVIANEHDGTMTGFGVIASNADGSVTKEATGVLPNANEWSHFAITRDKTTIKLYQDGKLVRTIPLTGKFAKLGTAPMAQVGKLFEQYFAGRVDDVRIYRRVLPDDEVEGLIYGREPMTARFSLTSDFVYSPSGSLLVIGSIDGKAHYIFEPSGRLLLYVPRLFL